MLSEQQASKLAGEARTHWATAEANWAAAMGHVETIAHKAAIEGVDPLDVELPEALAWALAHRSLTGTTPTFAEALEHMLGDDE